MSQKEKETGKGDSLSSNVRERKKNHYFGMLFHHMNNILRKNGMPLSGIKRMFVHCFCW